MHKKLLLLMLVISLAVALALAGCSGGESPAAGEVSTEEPVAANEPVEEPASAEEPTVNEEPAEEPIEEPIEEPADAEEALFDFYTTPSNWPRAVPAIMMEFKVTEYERTDNTMYAAGAGDVSMSRANNYYMNAKKKEGSTSFKWEFDSAKSSVTEGAEQVFYYIDDEGKSLAINLKEIGPNKIEFSLDYAE
jgi:hypothetical protein